MAEEGKQQAEHDSVLVIHGVGEHPPGALATIVAATLRRDPSALRGKTVVTEFNWNRIVGQALRDGELPVGTVTEAAVLLAAASLVRGGGSAVRGSSRWLRLVEQVGFAAAEIALAAAFSIVLIAAPVILALYVLSGTEDMVRPFGEALPWALSVSVAVFTSATAGMLLAALGSALSARSTAAFLVAVRRSVIVLLRPLVLVIVHFFLVPWKRFSRHAAAVVLILELTLVAGLAVSLLEPLLAAGPASDLLAWWRGPGQGLVVVLIAGAVTVAALMAMPLAVARYVGPSLKVLLDIFRYIADESYRRGIQAALRAEVSSLRDGAEAGRFFVVAHSLGSVIALHALAAGNCWRRADSLTLITLGSPIRRCFMRFFPGLFFPPSADEAATRAALHVGDFRWINCYRPRDPVGTAMGFAQPPYCVDLSTDQELSILKAHPDYWGDDEVRRCVVDGLTNTPLASVQAVTAEPYDGTPVIDGADHRKSLIRTLRWLGIASIVAMPILASALAAAENRERVADVPSELFAGGLEARASVTHRREVATYGQSGPSSYYDIFEFDFPVTDGHVKKEIKVHNLSPFEPTTYVFDPVRLQSFVVEQCSSWLKHVRRCRRDGIEVRYDPEQPERFVLPGFPPARTFWTEIKDWGRQLWLSLIITTWVAVLLLYSVGHFVRLLVGLDLDDRL